MINIQCKLKMEYEIRSEIMEYINKFKGTYDLNRPLREFKFNWLSSFDKELVKNVKIEYDCVYNERVWGDGDLNVNVLNDFIVSLEKMIKI